MNRRSTDSYRGADHRTYQGQENPIVVAATKTVDLPPAVLASSVAAPALLFLCSVWSCRLVETKCKITCRENSDVLVRCQKCIFAPGLGSPGHVMPLIVHVLLCAK